MKKKLNIAIFHLAFIYSGGGEKLVLQEFDGLKKLGHKVDIYTTVLDNKKSFPDIIKRYKINTFLPQWKFFKGHEAFQTVVSCILVPFYAFKFKNYDIILACNQPSPWIAYVVNKIYKIPYVSYIAQPTRFLHPRKIDLKTGLFFTKHASESIAARLMMTTFKGFSDWADKKSIRGSGKILVNGEYIQYIVNRVYKIKSTTCPPGVKYSKNIKFKKNNYLLVTNRHFPQKKIEYAIFVLNSIMPIVPNIRLIITGSHTDYTQRLRSLVKELGIEDRVNFMGYTDEKLMIKLYRSASCYLYTAPEEDFGMGIIEAMARGAPVVSWNAGGPSKIITSNVNGLLAKPYKLSDFTNKVRLLIRNKKIAREIIKKASLEINNNYSLKAHVDTLEKALQDVYSATSGEGGLASSGN